jgi:hypothetical protein
MPNATSRRMYRSYVLRCWESGEQGIVERFVVERVSDEPHRWVFSTFAELVEFLRAELLGEQPGDQPQTSPPDVERD